MEPKRPMGGPEVGRHDRWESEETEIKEAKSKFGKENADKLKKLNKKTYQDIISSMLKIKPSELILNLDKENIEFADKFLLKNKLKREDLIIGLNTGAGKRWPLKALSIEKTAELANKLIKEFKAKVLLFGGPQEEKRNKEIIKKCPKIT